MIRYLVLFLALLPLACSGCAPLPQPSPEPPPAPSPEPAPAPSPQPDPLPPPRPADDLCAAACGHLRELDCPAGNPTPAGTPCEEVCAHDRAESAARLTDRYLGCLATMAACRDDERCQR